jgi:acyl-CoA synthetase (AMP-forming)/AMP-acid ligase II
MHPGIHAKERPDHPAIVMPAAGVTLTHRELDEASNRVARLFRALGLRPGDGIAILLENHPRFYEIVWGAQRAGLYYTPMSTRLTPGEIEYIVTDCDAKVLITSAALAGAVTGLALPAVSARFTVGAAAPGFRSWDAETAAQPSTPIADEIEGSDLLYSSGTTGRPKGVKLALRGDPLGTPNALVRLSQALYGMDEHTVYLSPAPLYHAAPLRFNLVVQRLGGTCVIMEHFDASEFLRLIARHRVTHTQVVPTMFIRLLKLPDAERAAADVSSLRAAIHAAAPCPIPVKEAMIAWWGPKIVEYYAGTEGNGFCAITSGEWLAHKGSVGRPLLGTIHILDDEFLELPTGEAGTIYFEGGGTFEYHKDAEKTASSRSPEGWSTLGDIGYVDAEGYLYLTDRKANMIISGGVNIYPQECENLLATHPKVADCAVFGVPNAEFGEEVKAVVQPVLMADAGPELAEELMQFCRSHLSHVKCPRSIDFEAELPRHPTGKLYKRLLKDRYWQGHASRIL